MQNCLILINRNAGGGKKIDFSRIKNALGDGYTYSELSLPCEEPTDFSPYDCVAVCGGDGTLSSVMQSLYESGTEIKYFPSGTLNDKAKAKRYADKFHNGEARKLTQHYLAQKTKNRISNDLKQSPIEASTELFHFAPPVGGLKGDDLSAHKIKKSFTHNENWCFKSKSDKRGIKNGGVKLCRTSNAPIVIGKAGEKIFTYVLAAGSFTPIGYTAEVRLKQKYGVFAYLAQIIKEYRIHRIQAEIKTENQVYSGEFTLLMFLKSPRCFGFNFNRDYDEHSESGHFVAIRSPKHNGFLGKLEMFFPFFRVFFIGLKKPKDGKIIFRRVNEASLTLNGEWTFCNDGEKYAMGGERDIAFRHTKCKVSIINKF
jgi:diacylglycerol kinase family enzyme